MSLYVKNAKIVTGTTIFTGGIFVEGEKIQALVYGDPEISADLVIDARNKYLLPGLVDAHCHFNEPGRTDWEGIRTGSFAAAAGGVTTVFEMPLNSTPPTINTFELNRKRKLVESDSIIDIAHYGGVVDNNIEEIDALEAEGVIGYKTFLSNSGVDFERIDDDLLFEGLKKISSLGNMISIHSENEFIINYLTDKLKAEGRVDRSAWYEARPPETEIEAIHRVCLLTELTKGYSNVAHISTPDGIRIIAQAKQRGVHVTSETCPHYLFFDQEDFKRIGPEAKCAPPLRSRAMVEEMWSLVKDGVVDIIASDHSPCLESDKLQGSDNIWQAWGGITGIQTMLPAILTEGVHKRSLSLLQVVQMMSIHPAKTYGVYPEKGSLIPGTDADFIIVDLDKEWTLEADALLSKNKHSAYVGEKFKGYVEKTFVRGNLVYQQGEVVAKPGFGKAIRKLHKRNQPG